MMSEGGIKLETLRKIETSMSFFKIMQHQRYCRNYKDIDQSKQKQGLKRGWERGMMGGLKKGQGRGDLYSILFDNVCPLKG